MDSANSSFSGLTAEELKSQMFQSMQAAGVLHKLKGQLRQNMINELRGSKSKKKVKLDQSQKSDLLAATIRQRKTKPWIQQVLDNLVLHHIKQSRYHYTLSLFQQESGISSYSNTLTNELLARLGLQPQDLEVSDISSSSEDSSLPHSSTPKQSDEKENLTLWNLLNKLSTLSIKQPFKLEEKENLSTVELEKMKPLTLAEKLRAIDEDMKTSYRRRQRDPNITASTLASAIRRTEEDAERRSKLAFEEWKTTELSKVRIDETRKSKNEISQRIKSLENEYQSRRNELMAREKAAVDRLNLHREQLERDMHDQRQSLLRELDQIRIREEALHQKEQFINQMENMKLREIELIKTQQGLTTHVTPAANVAETKPEPQEPSIVSTLADSLRQSQDGKQVTTMKEMAEIIREVENKSTEIEKLTTEVTDLKNGLDKKQEREEKMLRQENMSLKNHLQELERQILSLKLEPTGKNKNHHDKEPDKLEKEVHDLRKDRDVQNVRQHQLEDMVLQMQAALKRSNDTVMRLTNQQPTFGSSSYPVVPPGGEPGYGSNLPQTSGYRSTQKDLLREYETLEPHVAPMMDHSSRTSTGVRFGILERLKDLDQESEEIAEQYKRYLRKNYRENATQAVTHSAPTNTVTKKPSPSKPNFFSKEPECDLLPTGKTTYSFAPDFLKDSFPPAKPTTFPTKSPTKIQNNSEKLSFSGFHKEALPALKQKETKTRSSPLKPLQKEIFKTDPKPFSTSQVLHTAPSPPPHGELKDQPQKSDDVKPSDSVSLKKSSSTSSVEDLESFEKEDRSKSSVDADNKEVLLDEFADSVNSNPARDEELPQVSESSTSESLSATLSSLDLRSDPLENGDQLSVDKEFPSDGQVGDYMEDIASRRNPTSNQKPAELSNPATAPVADPLSESKSSSSPSLKSEEHVQISVASQLEESLKLSMEDLELKSGASSPKSKSSTTSEDPHVDTVRRSDDQFSASKRDMLPPISSVRSFPSLPPLVVKRGGDSASGPVNSQFSAVSSGVQKSAAGILSSASSSVSEVEEFIESEKSSSKDEDVALFKMPQDVKVVHEKEDLEYEDSFEGTSSKHSAEKPGAKDDKEESLSGFSSVSIDLPSDSKPHGKKPIEKQIPVMTSFDDDAISAVFKWEDQNRPSLDFDDDDDSISDKQPGKNIQKPDDFESGSHDNVVKDSIDVFEQSHSQISFESDTSR
uniref:Oral-facial-digital syndrome 1 protein homolog n=1 Tax=Phallusia mammillata TaxID=59560 RepID=A0A6F9DNJ5_9ASCI|nr:oral-facial-digital syndrome 1 protein homolog [Phallusia mammillata]